MSDSVMLDNVDSLRDAVVGHKIVSTQWVKREFIIGLDNGTRVRLIDTDDCCAYTDLDWFMLNPLNTDHVITRVTDEDNHTVWRIMADAREVLKLEVNWSEGGGYYMYGFDIRVQMIDELTE